MGTLDDAIREHLELKKRSGAPDEEVKRLEDEAFGPVRREPAGAEVPPVEGDLEVTPPEADFPEPPEDASAIHELPDRAGGDDTAAVVSRPEPPPAAPEPWLDDDELEDGPSQSTSEFTAAEAADAAGAPAGGHVAPDEEGEDLLEETPDFLQETPEHDRLWFEQKPPRDFDFDE